MAETHKITNEDLKFCPFCGSKKIHIAHRVRSSSAVYWYAASCYGCEASSGEYSSLEELVVAWNGRATNLIPSERADQ